jgi:SAM-dependent methyltransferase
MPPLNTSELHHTTTVTLRHYNNSAESFWEGTRDHDVSQNVSALLRHLGPSGPHRILDLGCGPGRDLVTFRELGHEPVGLDGAERFVRMARQHAGCEVLHQDFLNLQLPDRSFDGVFANATLFHVPRQELARVIGELWQCLRPEGVLFCSNPHGPNREGWSGDRFCSYLDLPTWRQVLTGVGFVELEHYYRPPGEPQHRQPWLATVWRKPAPAAADPEPRGGGQAGR